jgi:hypothetical protein
VVGGYDRELVYGGAGQNDVLLALQSVGNEVVGERAAVDVDRMAPDGQGVAAGAGEARELGIELDRAVSPQP